MAVATWPPEQTAPTQDDVVAAVEGHLRTAGFHVLDVEDTPTLAIASHRLEEADHDNFVPTEPERFGHLLERFKTRLGAGFHQRAQEAVRCYGAHAYLACCVMCGAATESILLTVASRLKDEADVLKLYRTGSGRQRVENLIIGKRSERLKREFRGFTVLLNYWRDEAGHGTASEISDDEALTSITMLLRFAHFADDHWDELTMV